MLLKNIGQGNTDSIQVITNEINPLFLHCNQNLKTGCFTEFKNLKETKSLVNKQFLHNSCRISVHSDYNLLFYFGLTKEASVVVILNYLCIQEVLKLAKTSALVNFPNLVHIIFLSLKRADPEVTQTLNQTTDEKKES